jgi:exopolysaccharide production protein ExoZ
MQQSTDGDSLTQVPDAARTGVADARHAPTIEPIQYLRGFAAVSVLLHHVAFKLSRYESSPLGWLHCADAGVDVFFVISGFVMTHSVRDKHGAVASVGEFLRGRVARIIPLYWALTLVANLVFFLAPGLVNSSGGKTGVLASYFLLPTGEKYLIQNGWTLAYEFYFYALFAVGLLLPRTAGRAVVIAMLCLLGCSSIVLMQRGPVQEFLFDPLLLEFAGGMLLYLMYERALGLPGLARVAVAAVAVSLWLLVNARHSTGIRVLDYGVPAWLICLAAVSRQRELPPLRSSLLRWLGDISYSLYLVHPFVIAAVMVVLAHGPHFMASRPLVALCLDVGAAIVAGGLLYRFVEKPLTRAARRLLQPRAGQPSQNVRVIVKRAPKTS